MASKPNFRAVEGVWSPRTSGFSVKSSPSEAPAIVTTEWTAELEESTSGSAMVGCVPVDDLSCVYQPIVDLQDGKPFAYEVLARCRVPGLTNPEILFKRAAAERFCGLLGRTLRAIGSSPAAQPPRPPDPNAL